jgi:hypothetical protein
MKKSAMFTKSFSMSFLIALSLASTAAYANQAKERAIIDASLSALAHGHDLSLINAWHARAQTVRDGETYNTNFNSSCGALIYGYRESEKSIVQSNVTSGPEFPPHIAAIVLFAEARDPGSAISWKGTFAENGKVYDAVSIRPSYRGNRDAAYAPEQIWYFDQLTKFPKRVKFVGKGAGETLFLDDFRPSGDGWLVPFAANYSSGSGEKSSYQYSEIALKHEPCP